jgi:flavin-dependent dehydrogenase
VIRIDGAGPAGSAAAIAARQLGADVRIVERSRTARHKVCGEFISPEAQEVLQQLGAHDELVGRNPARMYRCRLRFGSRVKEWRLSEPALGLSRLELDRLLLDRALALGVPLARGEPPETGQKDTAVIIATGRRRIAAKPGRLFAFKSHYKGPPGDAVELFFDDTGYIGVSEVEDGITNLCGIATELTLRRYGFQFDDFIGDHKLLSDRMKPLTRCMPWLSTVPLVFSPIGNEPGAENIYRAGDALGFVDPFTGSGILNALLTGRLAGASAAKGEASDVYLRQCRRLLGRPFAVSAALRTILEWGIAPRLAELIPGNWIYQLTRAGSS